MVLQTTRYPYHISVARTALGLAGSMAAGGFFAYLAMTDTAPLHLFESVSFEASQAAGLYALIALAALVTLLFFLLRLRRSLKGPLLLLLDATSLHVPGVLPRGGMLSMPYASITRVMIHGVSNQQLIGIDSPSGRSRLSSIGFKTDEAFETFYKDLVARVGRHRKP